MEYNQVIETSNALRNTVYKFTNKLSEEEKEYLLFNLVKEQLNAIDSLERQMVVQLFTEEYVYDFIEILNNFVLQKYGKQLESFKYPTIDKVGQLVDIENLEKDDISCFIDCYGYYNPTELKTIIVPRVCIGLFKCIDYKKCISDAIANKKCFGEDVSEKQKNVGLLDEWFEE